MCKACVEVEKEVRHQPDNRFSPLPPVEAPALDEERYSGMVHAQRRANSVLSDQIGKTDYQRHSDLEAQRYACLQEFLRVNGSDPLLSATLRRWVYVEEKHFPQMFLGRALRDFKYLSLGKIRATPSVGETKLRKLLDVLERACGEIRKSTREPATIRPGAGDALHRPNDSRIGTSGHQASEDPRHQGPGSRRVARSEVQEIDEVEWGGLCRIAVTHHLDHYPLGRLATSLRYLPSSLWKVPVEFYTKRSLAEISRLPRHGERRWKLIVDVFRSLGRSLLTIPLDSHLKVCVVSAPIRDVSAWIENVLLQERVPETDEMHHCLAQRLINRIPGHQRSGGSRTTPEPPRTVGRSRLPYGG